MLIIHTVIIAFVGFMEAIAIAKQLYIKKPPKDQNGVDELNRAYETNDGWVYFYCKNLTRLDIFDFIRMLDASNYPKAFYKLGNKKIELTDVSLNNQFVKGKFIIKKK